MNEAIVGSVSIDHDREVVSTTSGEIIKFRPQTFSVFAHLYKHRGKVVTKTELLDSIWGSVTVTDDSIVKCISEIRKETAALAYLEIKTITRRGYLLTTTENSAGQTTPAEIPTIAVLSFNVHTDDLQSIAAGITEDVITQLTNQKDIFVLANHSTEQMLDADTLDGTSIGDVLNVKYLLQGSIQRQNNSIRINVQLSDAQNNTQLWSERYVETIDDIFELQDGISSKIVNRIGGSAGVLFSVERSNLQRSNPVNPEAHNFYIMASNVDKSLNKEGTLQVIGLYEQAVALDPLFSRAWVKLACFHLLAAACAYTDDFEATIEAFIKCAMRAIELDPNDSMGLAVAGSAYCITNELSLGREHFERALSLGPNNADLLALVSYTRPTQFSTVENDLENIRRAKSLNPYYPMWYALAHGYCAYHAREYQEAIDALSYADSDILDMQLYSMLSYAELGQVENANLHREKLLLINPDLTAAAIVEGDAMRNETAVKHFLQSAEKSGIPLR